MDTPELNRTYSVSTSMEIITTASSARSLNTTSLIAANGNGYSSPKKQVCIELKDKRKSAIALANKNNKQKKFQQEDEILNLQMESDLNLKQFPRRNALALMLSGFIFVQDDSYSNALPQPSVGLREYIDSFDGYSFKYPKNWIQVRGAGADIFFRDPFVLDENLSVDISSPSSSNFKSIKDLGPPEVAGERMLKQYLTEFMSTRLGVRRESSIRSTSSRVADDGKMYYVVEVNIKSYANNNELAVMPQDRVARLEWDRRYLSVLGVENKQLYELRLQTPENVFLEEESDLRQVMDSFRVFKVSV